MDILIKGNMQGVGRVLSICPENIAYTKITKNALRVIINETTGKVLYRHMLHDNISSITYDAEHEDTNITFTNNVPAMQVTDQISVKLYVQKEDIVPSDYAKQETLDSILALLQGDGEDIPEDVPEGVNEKLVLIMQYLGVPASISYTELTKAEIIAIARDCQYGVMGTSWPIPSYLPTGVTEANVQSAAEGLGIPYHEPTQTA